MFTRACLQLPILSQIHPVNNFPDYFPKIHLILSSYLCLGLLSGLFPSGFSTKILYAFTIIPLPATCPSHLFLLDFVTLYFVKHVSFEAPQLCYLLQPHATFPVGSKCSSQHLVLRLFSLRSLLCSTIVSIIDLVLKMCKHNYHSPPHSFEWHTAWSEDHI